VKATDTQRPGLGVGLIVVAIMAINALSISVVLPILPSIQVAIGADVATTQLVLSSYLLSLAAGQVIVGVLADRFGRRPVLMAGIGLFVAGATLAAVADSIVPIIAARFVQGFGGSAGIVIGRAIVRDLFDRERSASIYGYMTMGLAVAPMLAPAVGGVLDDTIGWRSVFLAMATVGVVAGTAAWRFLPETLSPETAAMRRSLVADMAMLLGVPAFWAYSLMLAFIAGVYFSFLGGAPFIATELIGLSATALGAFLAFVSVGYLLGNYLSGICSARLGTAFMVAAGNTVLCVAVAAMVAIYALGWLNAWTFFVPVALVGLGNGMAMPSALAGAVSVRPELAGTASGIAGTLQFGIGAMASAMAGAAIAAAPSALVLALIMTVLAVIATACGIWSRFAPE